MTQQLIPRAKGPGRVMVSELLICTPAVRAVIRERKIHQIYSLMQAGTKHGMQTMNQGLFQAYVNKLISLEEAMARSTDTKELEQMLEKVGVHVGAA
jgi:twitching motility protein PilT